MFLTVDSPDFHFPGLHLFPFMDTGVYNTAYDYNFGDVPDRYWGEKRLRT